MVLREKIFFIVILRRILRKQVRGTRDGNIPAGGEWERIIFLFTSHSPYTYGSKEKLNFKYKLAFQIHGTSK